MSIAAKNILIAVAEIPKGLRDAYDGDETEVSVQEFVDLWLPNRSPSCLRNNRIYGHRMHQKVIKRGYLGLKETGLIPRDWVTYRRPLMSDQLAIMDESFNTLSGRHAKAMASDMGLSQADLAGLTMPDNGASHQELGMAIDGTPF